MNRLCCLNKLETMKNLLLLLIGLPIGIAAQTSGDVVFGTDQVTEVRLTFTQIGFWDSLVANYSTETDMVASAMDITDNTGVHHFDNIAIRLKGNSSYGHPGTKKSFKVDFNDFVSGQKYDGMKKLNFNNNFHDPTFMRDKVFMDLCRQAGIQSPRINYCNVYMNNTFWGFYTFVEQVDEEFLQDNFAHTGGNLFKAGDATGPVPASADLKYYGATQSAYSTRYELKTNETLNDWSDLLQFIDFINNSNSTDFGNNFASKINKTTFMRSVAADVLFSSLDTYQHSARNYYIYHDSLNMRWEWIKWDGNETFGSYNGSAGISDMTQLAPNYVGPNRPLIQNMFNNPTLYAEYLLEMCWMMDQFFNNTYLDPKLDGLKTLIQTHVYADNLKQYSNAQFDQDIVSNTVVSGGMSSSTLYGLKSFVTARYNYLQGIVNCSLSITDDNVLNGVVYPNPFSNSFVIENLQEGSLVNIVDLQGKSVQFTLADNKIELMVTEGIYFVQIQKDNLSQTIKIVKQ